MKLEYIAEDSRGSAMSTGSLDIPSDSVENVTISGSKNGEIVYSVTDYRNERIHTNLRLLSTTT